jgi:hypothetical protein
MKPFLLGRKSLDSAPLRAIATPPVLPVRGQGHGHGHDSAGETTASIEVIKDGDKVVRLVVTCTCGEKIEVNCLYPANG